MLFIIPISILALVAGLALVEYIAPKPKEQIGMIELSDSGITRIFILIVMIPTCINIAIVGFTGNLIPIYCLLSFSGAFIVGGILGIIKLKYELKHNEDIPIIPKPKSYI